MNVALALNDQNEAMLLFDDALGFVPGWVECAADGAGIQIIGDGGESTSAGKLYGDAAQRLANVQNIFLVRMQGGKPAEGLQVPFIGQFYIS